MKYLVEDRDELYIAKGEEIYRLVSKVNEILDEEGLEELQRYEDRLLHEFYFVKAKIDLMHAELTGFQYRLSTLNEALRYIVKVAPGGKLAKDTTE